MIGFFDYTVVLTYISMMISMYGITLCADGHFKRAIVCLALSGLCDMFDGKIARTKKDRTEEEKSFGIQIDSLCDIVCFGILPIAICFSIGIRDVLGVACLFLYGLAGLIRLAFYNVKEQIRQNNTSENRKYYQGLPITSISVILPILYMLRPLFSDNIFMIVLRVVMFCTAVLFITDFKFRKPTNKELAVLVVVVAVAIIYMFSKHWLVWRMSSWFCFTL